MHSSKVVKQNKIQEKRSCVFHKSGGQMGSMLSLSTLRLPPHQSADTHLHLSPVPQWHVVKHPTTPAYINSTWLVPIEPPITSQRSCTSLCRLTSGERERHSRGDTTPCTKSNSYKVFWTFISAFQSVRSLETCWSFCFSPSWCRLSLPQRKVN